MMKKLLAVAVTLATGLSISSPSAEQYVDRAALAAAQYRHCYNFVLSNQQLTLGMPLVGISVDEFCRCQANTLISSVSDQEIARIRAGNVIDSGARTRGGGRILPVDATLGIRARRLIMAHEGES
jgi:hypothetical protein